MNAFAKVLVVILFLLSAAFAATQMVLYSKRVECSTALQDARKTITTLRNEAEQATSGLESARESYENSLNNLQGEISNLESQLQSATSQVEELKSEKTELAANLEQLSGSHESLANRLEQKEQRIASLEEEVQDKADTVDEKLATINEQGKELREKEEKVASLQDKLTNLQTEYAQLEEKKNQYEDMVSRLSARGISVPTEPVAAVDTTVVKVDPEYSLVVLGKGENAGIKVNYPFTIYRDGDYVAQALVYRVEDQLSLARIQEGMLAEGKQVKVGDSASTRFADVARPLSVSSR